MVTIVQVLVLMIYQNVETESNKESETLLEETLDTINIRTQTLGSAYCVELHISIRTEPWCLR